jgi:hypothetical protein
MGQALAAVVRDFKMVGRTRFTGKGDDIDQGLGQALFCNGHVCHAIGETLVRIGRRSGRPSVRRIRSPMIARSLKTLSRYCATSRE